MRFPRPPYWLVTSVIVLGLVFVALGHRQRADAPPPPPPLPPAEGALLAEAAPFNPALVVKIAPRPGRAPGTAFSVADGGLWLTAASVVEGCPEAAILVAAGEGVAAQVHIAPGASVAVLTTPGGAAALPLGQGQPTHAALAFEAGFDQARPAEVASRLIGAEALRPRGRAGGAQPVLVWGEIGRTEGLKGALAGLTGAPVLDGDGRVVGVVLGEAPRRGSLYAAAPSALTAALAEARAAPSPQAAGVAITADNYGLAADDLRRAFRIAPVVCVSR